MAKKSRRERKAETAREMSSATRTLRPDVIPTTPPINGGPETAPAPTVTATSAAVAPTRPTSRPMSPSRQQAMRQSSQLRAQAENTGARLSPTDLSREDAYVRHDLRNVAILASVLIGVLIVLAFVLPRALG